MRRHVFYSITLPALSAALVVLSFPTPSFWGLSFVALVPLLFALENAEKTTQRLVCGGLFGALLALGMGYWLFNALTGQYDKSFGSAAVFFIGSSCVPYALQYAVFALFHSFLQRDHLLFHLLAVPSLWIILDSTKELTPFLVPWGHLGYATLPFLRFIQIADVGGIHGVTFVVVMINSLVFLLLKRLARCASRMGEGGLSQLGLPVILLLMAFALPVAYGSLRIAQVGSYVEATVRDGGGIEAILVQGNFTQKERWSGMGFLSRVKTYLALSGAGEGGRPRVIVWPETVLNVSARVDDGLLSSLGERIGAGSLLISGGLRKGEEGVYNSACFVSKAGKTRWYDKHILLPYAEDTPGGGFLGTYHNAPETFERGRTPSAVSSPMGVVGASICLESLFPRHVRHSVLMGAEFLVNLSNDSWFGTSAMPYIHLGASRVRAIENRRFLLRASNSGISALISPLGEIGEASNLFTRQQVSGTFSRLSGVTLYTRMGDSILYFAGLWIIFSLMAVILDGEGKAGAVRGEHRS
ncbi:apolipoprotein N-acyltransferase [Desulfoluna limicola]|uniref:Apolipoprotein N-acyltransferase n=1 Tax=Desulfoluna limicola TaxID=2810562 RepID=A0ABN6F903_9BACT|nr:apolipoprotein N-acyltransferase [Desulfoluna limicola]BCS97010.1 apolipoprotein N-acyltransferase [Desulfoluna limicola]